MSIYPVLHKLPLKLSLDVIVDFKDIKINEKIYWNFSI